MSTDDPPGRSLQAANSFGLGPVAQISFAVADLEAVLPLYSAAFGPFRTRRITLDPTRATVRGEPARATLLVALGRSGDVEIELVQVEDGDFLTSEFVSRRGDGLHHLGFSVADIDAAVTTLTAHGFEVIFASSTQKGAHFRYVEGPEALGRCVFELCQRTPRRDEL